jgi:hypothetical protein
MKYFTRCAFSKKAEKACSFDGTVVYLKNPPALRCKRRRLLLTTPKTEICAEQRGILFFP